MEVLENRQRAWVLSSWQIIVERYPKMGESIIATTAPYGFKGFLGMRNFTLETEDGERLSWANSIWTNIDTQTGLPARLTDEDTRGYVLDEGVGVFNGDMGVITDISDYDEELTILFDDGRESVYNYKELDQIEHAFAVTIHKSQGSEYPAVIIPLLGGNRKLMNRNLIYTAITRARQLVIIVGDVNLVNQMVDNSEEQKRYTSLALRLEELNESME